LIEGMYNSISSSQELRNRLKTILHRLNRRAKYAPIANAIFKECQILYPETNALDAEDSEINSQISMPETGGIDEATTENTQINLRKKPDKRWVAAKATAQQPVSGTLRVRSAVIT